MGDMTPDSSWLQWAVGGIAAAGAFVFGHTHSRINQVETVLNERIARAEERQEKTTSDNQDFKERILTTLASKDDLREMRDQIMARINDIRKQPS